MFSKDMLYMWASLVAQRLKHLPPMRETQVQSLGWEDPLEKEMVTHSSIPAWRIPWMEKPGSLQSTGSQRVRHDWVISLHFTVSTVSPSISHEMMGPDAMIFVFWMLNFKPTFSLSSFTFIKKLFCSSSLSDIRVVWPTKWGDQVSQTMTQTNGHC